MTLLRTEIRYNGALKRWAHQHAGGPRRWLNAVHGHSVLINEAGKPLAVVRLLNHQWPKKDQRYSARIDGVEWWTTNILSTEPRFLTIRGFKSAKEAMRTIDEALELVLSNDPDAP